MYVLLYMHEEIYAYIIRAKPEKPQATQFMDTITPYRKHEQDN